MFATFLCVESWRHGDVVTHVEQNPFVWSMIAYKINTINHDDELKANGKKISFDGLEQGTKQWSEERKKSKENLIYFIILHFLHLQFSISPLLWTRWLGCLRLFGLSFTSSSENSETNEWKNDNQKETEEMMKMIRMKRKSGENVLCLYRSRIRHVGGMWRNKILILMLSEKCVSRCLEEQPQMFCRISRHVS